jgi:hypothetical protein
MAAPGTLVAMLSASDAPNPNAHAEATASTTRTLPSTVMAAPGTLAVLLDAPAPTSSETETNTAGMAAERSKANAHGVEMATAAEKATEEPVATASREVLPVTLVSANQDLSANRMYATATLAASTTRATPS